MTKIDLTIEMRDDLKTLKTSLKCKTYNDLLKMLMSDHHENKARGRQIKKLKAQLSERPAVPQESDDSRSIAPPTATPTAPIPLDAPTHPCPYHSDADDDLVNCSKDYDTRGVIHKVTQEICDQCWQRQQTRRTTQDPTTLDEIPCLCRYEHEGDFYCFFGRKPRKLEHGLKMCTSCKDRLTLEDAQAQDYILKTKKYVTCGATEIIDKTRGPMLFSHNSKCPHRKTWISINACEEANCPFLKKVKVRG